MTTVVDLTPIVQATIGIGAIAISVFGSWALNNLARRLGIEISSAQRARFDQAISKAAQAGAVAAEDMARVRGWDHPDVRNQMIAQGLSYAVSRFDATMKEVGLDPAKPENLMRIRGAIERVLPVAAAPIAASPITATGPKEAQP